MNKKHRLTEYLNKSKLITDGSFGTYYADKYKTDEMPELANTQPEEKEKVAAIHKEYMEAGAKLIRTNTFASNTALLNTSLDKVKENIISAINIAVQAKSDMAKDIFIAGDIGPLPSGIDTEQAQNEYYEMAEIFIQNGIDILNFETFHELTDILQVIRRIKAEALKNDTPVFIMVQLCVNQFGYSAAGLSAGKLLSQAADVPEIDAIGLNCGVGSGHMQQIISSANIRGDKFIIALPNAGYPERIRSRIRYMGNPEYFVTKVTDMSEKNGIDIVGGCCGTTPEFIRLLSQKLDISQTHKAAPILQTKDKPRIVKDCSFFGAKLNEKNNEKLIAVELAPPATADDKKLLSAAHMLEDLGVDVLTFPDSPSGRTRIDSVLMAQKVHRATGMCVMPHICCRDKNAIAMRSTFLGAHINDIHNFLIITGDPVPIMSRQTVKPVFNFDSVGLMNIARDMNEESFADCPLVYGGAINQGRRNLEVEIKRVKNKMEAGAEFFLTQPVFTDEAAQRVRTIKVETGARILCGIMPLISRKNAMFMKNEIAGVMVTDEIVERYPENASKEEGEAVGIMLAREIIKLTEDFADGYYFSFPFNRVHMLKDIING